MTRKDIARTIAQDLGLTQIQVVAIIQQVFDAILDSLVQKGGIELRNFGIFEVKKRKARKARNPKTGEEVWMSERLVVTFKPGREMLERVREGGKVPAQS
jgi:nucleoid DNA-binding protein